MVFRSLLHVAVMLSKKRLATIAEVIDLYKVTRRSALIFFGFILYSVVQWFFTIDQPTLEHTIFVSTVVGIFPAVLAFYTAKGVDWAKFHQTNNQNTNRNQSQGYRQSHRYDDDDQSMWPNRNDDDFYDLG